MISMVVLYNRFPFLDQTLLEQYASEAWEVEFESSDEAMTFVAGESPLFILRTEKQVYAVNHFHRPYFENTADLVDDTFESRAKHIIQNHRGWISIDLLDPDHANLDIPMEYARIGRLLQRLVNQDTVAVLIPDQMRLVPWDDSMAEILIGGNPLAELNPTNPPVLNISDDEPEMILAERQARARWPQFVTAFEIDARSEQEMEQPEQFSVKAPITVNQITEFIWITVTAIENQIIYGLLCNQPVSLEGLSKGDRVRVSVNRLNDWIYSHRGTSYGGFTVQILHDLANERTKTYLAPDDV